MPPNAKIEVKKRIINAPYMFKTPPRCHYFTVVRYQTIGSIIFVKLIDETQRKINMLSYVWLIMGGSFFHTFHQYECYTFSIIFTLNILYTCIIFTFIYTFHVYFYFT